MKDFWHFARMMFRYKRLMVGGGAAAILDALCAFAGFSMLMLLIDQLFQEGMTIQKVIRDNLGSERVVNAIGDFSHVADLLPDSPFWGLVVALALICLFTLLGATMRFLYSTAAFTISLKTIMVIRKLAFQRMIHAPYETVAAEGSADLLSRISRDSMTMGRGFNALLGKAVRDALMGIVFLFAAFIANWQLALLFILGAPLIGIIIMVFARKLKKASKRAMRAFGWMTGALQESTQAIAVVKVHNAEGYERRRFNTINRQVLKQELKARTIRVLSSPVIELLAIVGVCIVAAVAGWLIYEIKTVQAQDLLKVMAALGMAANSVKPLSKLNNELADSAAAAERVADVLRLPVEANTREHRVSGQTPLPRHHDSIAFESVAYAYPGADRDAIDDVTLEIAFGQTVAIVGPNGSGKSTLLNLLPRLTEPKRGRVLIDGVDIASVSLRSLRKQIAVVTQQSVLFEGTIADNIAYGRRHEERAKIEAAARAAFAHEFVEPLPGGYDTSLGEMGAGLSGGQKQRLCIARAILRDPAILILDEATSQVDADSEAKINEALHRLREGRTTLVIAHRLSTVIDADMIVVMDDGRVVDRGTHSELQARCQVYQTLTRTQLNADHQAVGVGETI